MMKCTILIALAILCSNFIEKAEPKFINYNTSQNIVPGKLNVHLVAHSHDDVGWLKTVDQYYVGSNNSIQGACVQNILDSLIPALLADKNRKFIFVEQAFFQRWWREQKDAVKSAVKELVSSGQLEFINGGMCMHDEAVTHYVDMIDQTTLGHRFIKKEFNVTPRIGWQIDPFGHSSVQAYLLGSDIGFDSFFYGRIDYQDREYRKKRKQLEVVWEGSKSFGSSSQIFAGAFPENYEPPPGDFYFEVNDHSPVVQDDVDLFDYNVQERVDDFVAAALAQANITRTNHIMFTMGTDFKYQYATSWFRQLDKLIHYVNIDGRVNALYSSPSVYTDAKHASNEKWPLKTEDFFPYADRKNAYWTGYFSSRPALKRYVRMMSGYYVAARQLEVLLGKRKEGPNTNALGDAMAIAQHHDAVTGTEKQHVADDYAKRLYIGYEEAAKVVSGSIATLVGNPTAEFKQCPLLNESVCEGSEISLSNGKDLIVVVYNALGWKRTDVIRFPITTEDVVVWDSDGDDVESQVIPMVSGDKHWIAFSVSVPPLGFSTYVVSKSQSGRRSFKSEVNLVNNIAEFGPGKLQLLSSRGRAEYRNIKNNLDEKVERSFIYYSAYNASKDEENQQNAGAYIFRPNGTFQLNFDEQEPMRVYRGPVLDEVHEQINSWIHQVTRVYKESEHVEVEFTVESACTLADRYVRHSAVLQVGPVPIDDNVGKEVVTKISSSIKSNKTFYTDSNGRDFLKRIRDSRTDWNLDVNQPVAGNYYPVNLGIYIQDEDKELSLLVDRPLGASSLADGEIELMLHRRLLLDDSRGVDEALNETVCYGDRCSGLTIRGRYFFRVDDAGEGAKWRRTFGQEIYSPLLLAFAEENKEKWRRDSVTSFSGLKSSYELPENVAIITLEEMDEGEVLLRLGHLYEVGEEEELSGMAKVELRKMFGEKEISEVVEMSLSGNQERAEMEKKKLRWKTESSGKDPVFGRGGPVDPVAMEVHLRPMEIRTFILRFQRHAKT